MKAGIRYIIPVVVLDAKIILTRRRIIKSTGRTMSLRCRLDLTVRCFLAKCTYIQTAQTAMRNLLEGQHRQVEGKTCSTGSGLLNPVLMIAWRVSMGRVSAISNINYIWKLTCRGFSYVPYLLPKTKSRFSTLSLETLEYNAPFDIKKTRHTNTSFRYR